MLSDGLIKTFTIWRVNKNTITKSTDLVAKEAIFRLFVDGSDLGYASLSPADLEDYAVGRVVSEGILRYKEIKNVIVSESNISITSTRPIFGSEEEKTVSTAIKLSSHTVLASIASLTSLGENWSRTGAFHLAVLFDQQGHLIRAVEDLGRHNAADKIIGYALRHEVDLSRCFIASSGRQPADMVSKAARVGLPIVISRAATTDRGIESARQAGITLIGFAREDHFTIYTHPERITGMRPEFTVLNSKC